MPNQLYLSIVWLVLGGCVGSFLNVVIYRLPRGVSVRRPARSFCPACQHPIAWYDNLPVVSYLVLGARCRRCGVAIPLRYPLVELVTAAVFLMTYQAFFVLGLREGVTDLSADWPIFLAHLALWAGLIALSVMDLEAYLVDIAVTWVLAGVGLVAHVLWTPARSLALHADAHPFMEGFLSGGWIRPGPWQAGFTAAVVVGLIIGAWVFLRKRECPIGDASGCEEEGEAASGSAEPRVSGRPGWGPLIVVGCVALVVLYVWSLQAKVQALSVRPEAHAHAAGGSFLTPLAGAGSLWLLYGTAGLFVLLALAASHPHPAADTEIVEAIASEAADSRRQALWELKLLVPAIVLAGGVIAVLWNWEAGLARLAGALAWQPVGHWRPLLGLACGSGGWVIGGLIGWLARIFFTLVFGKEALGMGDVHILAAAGAVAGWPVVLLGFFLAAPLALLALVVIAARRQSRALPYGPWLAMAFFLAGLFQDVLLRHFHVRWVFE